MADRGTHTPLTARSVRDAVCEAMGSAVPEGFRPQAPTLPLVAAGADEPESVAVDRVAADPAVFDTDTAAAYRDGVEHRPHLDRPPVASQGAPQHSERDGETVEHSYLECGACLRVVSVPRGSGLPEECPYCHTWRVGWASVDERRPPPTDDQLARARARWIELGIQRLGVQSLEPNDWHRPDDANREREGIRQARLARWQRQP